MDDEETLKACPCCGEQPVFSYVDTGENAGGNYIECSACGLSTRLIFACGDDPKPLLREAWNRRTGDTCARMCEGTAYRIEGRRLKAELRKVVDLYRAFDLPTGPTIIQALATLEELTPNVQIEGAARLLAQVPSNAGLGLGGPERKKT